MKKIVFFMSVCALIIGMSSCKSNTESKSIGDNSRVSLDWAGTYSGVVPCADCPGIETIITLYSTNRYKLETRYLDRGDETYTNEGNFEWNKEGSIITLKNLSNKETPSYYKVGENQLIQLDMKGNEIPKSEATNYTLKKVNEELVEKYWKLEEIMGKPISEEKELMKDAYITFKVSGNRVIGNGGCNGFSGTYELGPGDRISFSRMASTMMMCPNMEVERKMHEVFEKTDSYAIKGDTLSLNRARMAPLARFVAVYM